jgi:putative endopeptidase
LSNSIEVPAAILEPPFFTGTADEAANYGAIGAFLAHELIHGFDVNGRRYDGSGNLRDWWQKSDEEEFRRRAEVLVEEYNEFVPIDSSRLNGRLTVAENMADLGGVSIAYQAYHNSLAGRKAPVIDGLTGDQRFFIAWGQIWAEKIRDEELRRRIVVDPHSPGKYRVNGVAANMVEFYEAFNVRVGDPMYRDEMNRVTIW